MVYSNNFEKVVLKIGSETRGRFKARDLVDKVNKNRGNKISSRKIARALSKLIVKGFFKRSKIRNTLHEYEYTGKPLAQYNSKVPIFDVPDCCKYSSITIDINPNRCVSCGKPRGNRGEP